MTKRKMFPAEIILTACLLGCNAETSVDAFDPPDISPEAERLHKLSESDAGGAPVREGEVKAQGSLMDVVTNGLVISTEAKPEGTHFALSPKAVVWEDGNQINIDSLSQGDHIEVFTKQAGNRADGYQTLVERINVLRRTQAKPASAGESGNYTLPVHGIVVEASKETVKIRDSAVSDSKGSTFPVAPTVEVHRAGVVGKTELLKIDDVVTLTLQSRGNRQDGYISVATRIEVEPKADSDSSQ